MTEAEHATALGVVGSTAKSLIDSLPAQFLMLVILNSAFIGGMLWFLNNAEDRRERVFGPMLTTCMKSVPIEVLEDMIKVARP